MISYFQFQSYSYSLGTIALAWSDQISGDSPVEDLLIEDISAGDILSLQSNGSLGNICIMYNIYIKIFLKEGVFFYCYDLQQWIVEFSGSAFLASFPVLFLFFSEIL